jgi:large-conductance mechanosensitive channel
MLLFERKHLALFLLVVAVWIGSLDQAHKNGKAAVERMYHNNQLVGEFQNTGGFESAAFTSHRQLSGGGGDDDGSHVVHPSLFQALKVVHVDMGTYSVIIIIGFIIFLKLSIETLSSFTEETAFHGMVKKIEEELMIVGCSSFIFKIILNTSDFGSNEWVYPLEFGEVLVPLIAFSYCAIGIFLIVVSLNQCYTWSRAHNLKTMEILDDYFEASKTLFFRFVLT